MSNRIHKTFRTAAAAGAFVMVGSMLSGTAEAAESKFDFFNSSYILTMRSAGIEYYDYIPRLLTQQQGFSFVDLIHDTGQEAARCEAIGAGYWLSQEVEEGVLGPGAAPPDAGDISGGYKNPTVSRSVEPNLSPGENESNKNPGIQNYFPPGQEVVDIPETGAGVKWIAKCDNDVKGAAQGDQHNVGGVQAIGSVTQGSVDKTTGVYTGTARAYTFGVEGVSGFDSFSSFMQVVNKPNDKPVITFRMSYFNSGENKDKNGVSFGGSDIPVEDFAKQYNEGAKTFSEAFKPVGPIGSQTLKPEVGISTDGGRFSISISAATGHFGFAAREGTIGQDQGARFGSINFEGVYGGKAEGFSQPNL